MYLCDDNHEEVCHENRKCPVCELIAEKDEEIIDLKREKEGLKDEIETMQEEQSELENELQELRSNHVN